MTDEALQIIEDLHDEKHYAEGEDAQILDVNVYINFDAYKRLKNRQGPYAQFVKYKEQHDAYYAAVLAVYDRVQADGYELRPEFNTLVTRCIGLLAPKNRVRQRLQLVDKKEPVEFISVEITYAYTRKVGVGYKFTGRDQYWHGPISPRGDLKKKVNCWDALKPIYPEWNLKEEELLVS